MMQISKKTRLFNIIFRGCILLSKFILVFFLAKYLPQEDLGIYGLIVATIMYALYPLGFDYYLYNTRKIIESNKINCGSHLKNQAALHLCLYFIVIPALFLLFINELLPWRVSILFFPLLIAEHINQEIYRILVGISRQTAATKLLFIRHGAWPPITILCMYLHPSVRNLNFVLSAWLFLSIVALVFSIFTIYAMRFSGWRTKVSWPQIGEGIRIAFPLFVATLTLNSIWTIDKYWFKYLQGDEVLSAYVFFLALVSSSLSILEAGVFSFAYPSIIKAISDKNIRLAKMHMKEMAVQIFLFFLLFFPASIFLLKIILPAIDNKLYNENICLFYLSLLVAIIFSYTHIPDYLLYACRKDIMLLKIHIGGFLVFIISTCIFSHFDSYAAVPAGMAISFLTVLLWKCAAALDVLKISHTGQQAP